MAACSKIIFIVKLYQIYDLLNEHKKNIWLNLRRSVPLSSEIFNNSTDQIPHPRPLGITEEIEGTAFDSFSRHLLLRPQHLCHTHAMHYVYTRPSAQRYH